MSASPVPVLFIVVSVLVFEGVLFGAEIAEQSFPSFDEPNSGGFFGALDAILAVIQAVWGAVVFFFNLVTFNVPDAPWYVRVPVGGLLSGSLVWSVARLIRGN